MRIIGFSFTKILAERNALEKVSSINTNVDFKDIKEEITAIIKEEITLNLSFDFVIRYESDKEEKKKQSNETKIAMTGHILISVTKEESKNILKDWKKKEIPNSIKVPIFNFVLRKCTPKALLLEEDLGLPSHIPIPKLKAQASQE